MRKRILATIIILALGLLGTGLGLTVASASTAASTSDYCVTFGHGTGATGNVVEFNWDHSQCPTGTYPHNVTDSDPFTPASFFLNSGAPSGSTGSESGLVFRIIDTNVNSPGTYDCFFTVPTPTSQSGVFSPGITCSLIKG